MKRLQDFKDEFEPAAKRAKVVAQHENVLPQVLTMIGQPDGGHALPEGRAARQQWAWRGLGIEGPT